MIAPLPIFLPGKTGNPARDGSRFIIIIADHLRLADTSGSGNYGTFFSSSGDFSGLGQYRSAPRQAADSVQGTVWQPDALASLPPGLRHPFPDSGAQYIVSLVRSGGRHPLPDR